MIYLRNHRLLDIKDVSIFFSYYKSRWDEYLHIWIFMFSLEWIVRRGIATVTIFMLWVFTLYNIIRIEEIIIVWRKREVGKD